MKLKMGNGMVSSGITDLWLDLKNFVASTSTLSVTASVKDPSWSLMLSLNEN